MKNNNKLFILGLDGLEYNLVKERNLTNLMQLQNGTIEVPIHGKLKVPLSPQVWASFLTGKVVNDTDFKTSSKVHDLLIYARAKIEQLTTKRISLGLSRKVRPRLFPKLNQKTFLDLPHVAEINAPFYSYDEKVLKTIGGLNDDQANLDEVITKVVDYYLELEEYILDQTTNQSGNIKVTFAFMPYPDILHHLLFLRPLEIHKHYEFLDVFVEYLKLWIDPNTKFIIVSDHGFNMTSGEHSNYGFFSSNKTLSPKPTNITNFYNLVVKK